MQKETDLRLAKLVTALASLGAGLIHLAVTPGHWREWIVYGVFFLGLAVFQIIWAVTVIRFPYSGIVSLGLTANLASMALWGASRVWGPPMGPASGVPEPVGTSGVLTVALEAVTVLGALWLLLPRQQTAVLTTGSYRFALSAAVLALTMVTAPGAVSGLGHSHGGQGHGSHGESGTSSETQEPGAPQDAPVPRTPSSGTAPPPSGPVNEDHSGGHSH